MKIALNLKKGPKMSEIVRYSVKFDLLLDKNDTSDPSWIQAIVQQALNLGERVENFELELMV